MLFFLLPEKTPKVFVRDSKVGRVCFKLEQNRITSSAYKAMRCSISPIFTPFGLVVFLLKLQPVEQHKEVESSQEISPQYQTFSESQVNTATAPCQRPSLHPTTEWQCPYSQIY